MRHCVRLASSCEINIVYEQWVKLPCARSAGFSKIFIEFYPPSIGSLRLREQFSDIVSTFATRWQEREKYRSVRSASETVTQSGSLSLMYCKQAATDAL